MPNVQRTEHVPPDRHADFYCRQGFTLNLTRINPSVNTYQAYWLAIPLG